VPSPYTYRDRFGRWNEALREAGLTPRHTIGLRGSQPTHFSQTHVRREHSAIGQRSDSPAPEKRQAGKTRAGLMSFGQCPPAEFEVERL
jgi:hypothetical protein